MQAYGFSWFEGDLYGVQSWYWGYILALVLVIIASAVLKRKAILWLPLAIMLALCTAIKLISLDFAEASEYVILHGTEMHKAYLYNSFSDINAEEGSALLVVKDFVYRAGMVRWNRAAPMYILSTEVFAITAYIISSRRGRKKLRTYGISALILVALLLLCVLDRSFALSARMLLHEPYGIPEEIACEQGGIVIYRDIETGAFWGSPVTDFNLGRQLIYSKPDKSSAPEAYSENYKKANSSDKVKSTYILTTNKRGWAYVYQSAGLTLDKSAYLDHVCGFIPLENAIRSGIRNVNLRPHVVMMRTFATFMDMYCFSAGFGVTENFMHVFVPFEIYLLAPLTVIFAAAWCIMLIRGRWGKTGAA